MNPKRNAINIDRNKGKSSSRKASLTSSEDRKKYTATKNIFSSNHQFDWIPHVGRENEDGFGINTKRGWQTWERRIEEKAETLLFRTGIQNTFFSFFIARIHRRRKLSLLGKKLCSKCLPKFSNRFPF